jgi:glycosyltransferase involved in cell wall biosynthesis
MVRRELDIDEGAEVVVSVGALNWEKDPLAQLEVFGRVAQKRPASVLVMVGQGPLEDATRQAAENLHLAERVRMLGVRNDVPDILAASDVLLLASKTEGMPGVVIEAGIANLPVAGYRLSGVPEVVVNGSTGLLARAGDVDGLATCVTKVLAEAESRVRMGRAAHRRCIERFTMESIAPSYLEVYRRVTNSPRMAQEVEEKL